MSQLLKKYLERRYVDRNDKTISTFFPAFGRFLRTRKVWKRLHHKGKHHQHEGPVKEIIVGPYEGENKSAIRIREFLNEFRHPAIKAAIIQGSIATGEETSFSDFDGILIIDKDAIQNKRQLGELHKIVHESAHLMKRQDSLQHHGWSVLLKQEFKRYPDAELPALLLEKGKLLYPAGSMQISIVIDPAYQDYTALYENLCSGIYRRLENNATLQSYYHTKLLVSECLLLPAAFLQALKKSPVWKADSFEQIKSFLKPDYLQVLTSISDIRIHWDKYYNGRKKSAVHPDLCNQIKKNIGPKIKDLIDEMDNLLDAQEKRSS